MAYLTVDELRVASPCTVPFDSMKGDDLSRHCDQCQKSVYNLSELTREEGNALLLEKEGKLCVFYYKRLDGTILTADCPKGLRAIRRHYLKARARSVATFAALLGFIGFSAVSCRMATSVEGDLVVPDSTADSVTVFHASHLPK